MWPMLGVLLIYLIRESVLIAVGIGVGCLLHRMIPTVDVVTGIFIGVMATSFTIHYFTRLMRLIRVEEDVVEGTEGRPGTVLYPISPARPRRKRNRSS